MAWPIIFAALGLGVYKWLCKVGAEAYILEQPTPPSEEQVYMALDDPVVMAKYMAKGAFYSAAAGAMGIYEHLKKEAEEADKENALKYLQEQQEKASKDA